MIKYGTMEKYVADRAPHLAPKPLVHLHQGGTVNTYCGEALTLGTAVSWEVAHEATCLACHREFFPAQSAARAHAEREASFHGSTAFGR